MKVAVLCKSDGTGGAAIVSMRLMEALRMQGVDAKMLVAEKITESPYVYTACNRFTRDAIFIKERLSIFFKNGFDRSTLFQIDTGETGLPVSRHPVVKEADAVILNWVNQGMVSLREVEKIASAGKPVIWTMHDMWNFTGICHHAFSCRHFLRKCGDCRLLGQKKSPKDLSHSVWKSKMQIYGNSDLTFVAISRWLLDLAKESSLLRDRKLEYISNPFPVHKVGKDEKKMCREKKIIFGAARLDDPIKGFDILTESVNLLIEKHPELRNKTELILYGDIRNPALLENIKIKHRHAGRISGFEELGRLYAEGDVVVSTSHYETTGTTLVEGEAFGAIPVCFDRGGQSDIVSHLQTGYLVDWSDDKRERAENMSRGLYWALTLDEEEESAIKERMKKKVEDRFSYEVVARQYIDLIRSLLDKKKNI